MLYYCGFESFLKFKHKSGINNIFLRPLSDLILDNCDQVINAYIGWCSLFLQTGNGRVVYLGYSNPLNNNEQNHNRNDLMVCEKAPKYIINIECGSKETMVLTLDLVLYKWTGFNFANTAPIEISDEENSSLKIEQISVGVEYSCILTDSGEAKLFSPTDGKIGNKLTDKKITSISSGQEHVLLLTDSGRVLSFGRGSRGQLGHGDVEDVTESAELIDALDGIKIKSIAAGGWHSLALSMDGDVYVWGWNESGQLGYSKGTINMKALPLPLEISDDDSFIAISAGSRHSMAVSENGILFGWGWNKWGQLGLDPKTYIICDTPQVIPVDEKVKNICCKFWSSLIETEREPTPEQEVAAISGQ